MDSSGNISLWKGEDNILDSIGTHHGILQGSSFTYVTGAIGKCFDVNYTSSSAGEIFYVPAHDDFNIDPFGAFKISFYLKLKSTDIYRDNYLIIKNQNYVPGLVNDIDWGIRVVNGLIKFVVYLGSHTNTEFESGGTVAYDDSFHFVECVYDKGYWSTTVDYIDQTINPTTQHLISNHTNYNIGFGTIFNCLGQTGTNYCIDEIKIGLITPADRRITPSRDISPILINQRVASYKRDSLDKLQVKLVLNNRGRLSYLKNIPVEFYLNYTGSFIKYVDTTTNNNGVANFTYSCANIEEAINSCVGYVKVTVDSVVYTSNLIKFNFDLGGQGFEREIQLYPADIMLYSSDIINL